MALCYQQPNMFQLYFYYCCRKHDLLFNKQHVTKRFATVYHFEPSHLIALHGFVNDVFFVQYLNMYRTFSVLQICFTTFKSKHVWPLSYCHFCALRIYVEFGSPRYRSIGVLWTEKTTSLNFTNSLKRSDHNNLRGFSFFWEFIGINLTIHYYSGEDKCSVVAQATSCWF